ncbi:HAD-IA family hydrolase [Rhodophyticola porphyridii]|uniref:phosphoglycolate phosphatase n=1 Tax=Rhodophyticola porphyridii TaxID=1852017 RepID=A0A3L9Y6M1_9RHOB|nr:HAD-IA family hydrolase [Rhodophyticola porphyridii]RMA42938.1 HAD family hydrolase [Rhodophyticola porphyridii]
MRCVIFDLDGTLADTSGDLIAAANAALEALGHSPQLVPGRDDATAFRGGRAMLKLGFERLGITGAAADVDEGYPVLLQAYGAAIDTHTTLYPGAMAAVDRLRRDGVAVGICTNKPQGLAETLMTRLGVRDSFASLVGADTLPVRKPDPAPYLLAVEQAGGDPARSLLIGDTETDRKTARAAGVPCVLVAFGPDGRGVNALAPEALLERYDDLDSIVGRLIV